MELHPGTPGYGDEVPVIQRRVVIPTGVDRLWRALTDPEEAGRWLGGQLDWDPEEGGGLKFVPGRGAGAAREGRVEEVIPGRYMRFVWWPVDSPSDQVSEVSYSLQPVDPGGDPDQAGQPGHVSDDHAADLAGDLAGDQSDDQSDGLSAGEATILTVEEVPARAPAASASLSASRTAGAVGFASTASWTLEDEFLWRTFADRERFVALAR